MGFWHVLFATFSLVFLAELGDKTQLAVLLMAAQDRPVWGVFFGAASALVLSSLLAVLLGGVISNFISPALIQKGAGIVFIIIGFLLLAGKI